MSKFINFTREEIVLALMAERHHLASARVNETDVRLVVYEPGTWSINHGDVSYDTEHGIACGSGTLNLGDTNAEIATLASDLIEQVEDQLAEVES